MQVGAVLAALKTGWERGVKVAVGALGCPGSCRDHAGWGLDAWQHGVDVLREAMVLCGVISTSDRVRVQRLQPCSQSLSCLGSTPRCFGSWYLFTQLIQAETGHEPH